MFLHSSSSQREQGENLFLPPRPMSVSSVSNENLAPVSKGFCKIAIGKVGHRFQLFEHLRRAHNILDSTNV